MSKRKHRPTRPPADLPGKKPAAAPRFSGSMIWIVLAVVLAAVGVFFLKSRPADESSVKPDSPSATDTNRVFAKAPPAPAPSAPTMKPVPAGQPNAAGAPPPSAKIDTNSVSDMLNLGTYLLKKDRLEDAERAYRRAVEINPDDEDSHFNLGVVLARQQRFVDASNEYSAALQIYPDYVEVKNNLANVLIKLGHTNEAIGQLEEAVRLNPDYVQALNNLGRMRAVQGDLDKAKTLLDHAAKLDPKDFEVQFNLGNVAMQKGDNGLAATYFENARNLKPDNLLAINLLAKTLTLSGKPEKALELVNKAMEQHPNSPELLYNAGLLEMGLGHPAQAVPYLQQVVKLAPTFAPAQKVLQEAEKAAAKATTPKDLKSAK